MEDNWDDWSKYQTVFNLVVFDEAGERIEIGQTKIGEKGLKPSNSVKPGFRAPTLASEFDAFDEEHFSLGQSESFYESLTLLGPEARERILSSLRDCALNLKLFSLIEQEEVTQESLLRGVSASTVRTRFHRLAQGNALLSKYKFHYILPTGDSDKDPVTLHFSVIPDSHPPTNVHVLIGRNGVGKSRCIQGIARCFVSAAPNFTNDGFLEFAPDAPTTPFSAPSVTTFTGVVSVSFSAFDTYSFPTVSRSGIKAAYVGLQVSEDSPRNRAKSRDELAEEFVEAIRSCRRGVLADRLTECLNVLSADPLLADAEVSHLVSKDLEAWEVEARNTFFGLSSGHAIVLLTIAKLVETVGEKTLVLLDEPESHLHPPLLSALVRCISTLLINRNGVAIVSTHSPVVLQEVPRNCVWILHRTGDFSQALRPTIETFGENVANLTREVFDLEVTNSGFHNLLRESVERSASSYQELLDSFGGQLGADARAILMTLVSERARKK